MWSPRIRLHLLSTLVFLTTLVHGADSRVEFRQVWLELAKAPNFNGDSANAWPTRIEGRIFAKLLARAYADFLEHRSQSRIAPDEPNDLDFTKINHLLRYSLVNKQDYALFLQELALMTAVPSAETRLWLLSHQSLVDIPIHFFESKAGARQALKQYQHWLDDLSEGTKLRSPRFATQMDQLHFATSRAGLGVLASRKRILDYVVTGIAEVHQLARTAGIFLFASDDLVKPFGDYRLPADHRGLVEGIVRSPTKTHIYVGREMLFENEVSRDYWSINQHFFDSQLLVSLIHGLATHQARLKFSAHVSEQTFNPKLRAGIGENVELNFTLISRNGELASLGEQHVYVATEMPGTKRAVGSLLNEMLRELHKLHAAACGELLHKATGN